ncbi:Uncharacterized membrane protein [Catalinimonas alkaloidigena]|uniref:Uncharacterized membrane protein n=1 Tax=Catalinimonas alkaloidigena TaxID=1075417 RepID=A0A1G9P9Y3_9BACT|nr:DUF1361 domain-containing protein [Catalinimonas alkaloidigena]SDL95682.1 Uncharacterized membrane protein [Catalinimonas alkaloidigena]
MFGLPQLPEKRYFVQPVAWATGLTANAAYRPLIRLLALMSFLCVGQLALRVLWTWNDDFAFFSWNLLLAWVPLGCVYLLRFREGLARWKVAALMGAWLLFLPNAPYLITDLLHLRHWPAVFSIVDELMVFAFALTGLLVGWLSMFLMHELAIRSWGEPWSWAFVAGVSVLTGFGVYLGRVQRWNSWDIVTRPLSLVWRAGGSLDDLTTWVLTVLMALIFFIGYLFFHQLIRLGIRPEQP